MGKIKTIKDIATNGRASKIGLKWGNDLGVDGKDKPRYVEDDIMDDKQLKYNSKIKIKAYDECIEVIDKFIREKSKTRNVFYVSDLNEIKNQIVTMQEKEDEKI